MNLKLRHKIIVLNVIVLPENMAAAAGLTTVSAAAKYKMSQCTQTPDKS